MKSLRKQLGKESVSGVLFTLPFIIGFILFMIVPMGISLYYSFCDYDILSPPVFSGLNNFKEMLKDDILIQSIKVTFYFAFVSFHPFPGIDYLFHRLSFRIHNPHKHDQP